MNMMQNKYWLNHNFSVNKIELSYWIDFSVVTRERIQSRSLEIDLKDIKNCVEDLEDSKDLGG